MKATPHSVSGRKLAASLGAAKRKGKRKQEGVNVDCQNNKKTKSCTQSSGKKKKAVSAIAPWRKVTTAVKEKKKVL